MAQAIPRIGLSFTANANPNTINDPMAEPMIIALDVSSFFWAGYQTLLRRDGMRLSSCLIGVSSCESSTVSFIVTYRR